MEEDVTYIWSEEQPETGVSVTVGETTERAEGVSTAIDSDTGEGGYITETLGEREQDEEVKEPRDNYDHMADHTFHNNVTIAGTLRTKRWVHPYGALFLTEEKLLEEFPAPKPGMWANVGAMWPFRTYVCMEDGKWTATPSTEYLNWLSAEKADKSVRIIAGDGLTGGGTLASDVRLGLSGSGVRPGTYTKVTVDSYGRVTYGDTLSGSDLPDQGGHDYADARELAALRDLFYDLFEKETAGGKTRIKAKYGLYSVGFLSAYGLNDKGGGAGAGATRLGMLEDVLLGSDPESGEVLVYNGTRWVNQRIETGGIDYADLSDYLMRHAYVTSSALSGYATEDWVLGKGYLSRHQDIHGLTFAAGSFTARTYSPTESAQTVNIPTTTSHITEGSRLYFTDARAQGALASTVSALNNAIALKLDKTTFEEFKAVFDDMFELETVGGKTRIKAKYGLYSVGFLSAYGLNDKGGGAGAGATRLGMLEDVLLGSNLASGEVLVYNGTRWVNQRIEAGGIDYADLGQYLTQNGYATEDWVLGKGYATQAALSALSGDVSAHVGDATIHVTAVEKGQWSGTTTRLGRFLAGVDDNTNLLSLLSGKADKSALENYVTLDTEQEISGAKKFTDKLIACGNWSDDNGLYLYEGKTTTIYGAYVLYGKNDMLHIGTWNGSEDGVDAMEIKRGSADVTFKGAIRLGDITLSYDAERKGIRVSGGLYTDTFLSAYGFNGTSGGATGGLNESELAEYLTRYNYITVSALSGYATQTWVNQQGFLKSVAWGDVTGKPSWIGSTKPSYAFSEIASKPTTLSGYGITDAKIANGVITLGGSTITPLTSLPSHTHNYVPKWGSDGVLEVARYIDFHNINNGVLGSEDYTVRLNAGTAEVSREFTFPLTGGTIATTTDLGNYLPLTGGNISNGNVSAPLNIYSSHASEVGLRFYRNSTAKGWIGYHDTYGTNLYNYATGKYLGVRDDGHAYYDGKILLHSGNISSYAITSHQSLANYVTLDGVQTITGNKRFTSRILRNGVGQMWIHGRNGALIVMDTLSGYSPLWSIKTNNGSWDVGAYDNPSFTDRLIFTFITDSNYSAGTNNTTTQILFHSSGIVAPAFVKSGGTSSQFLKADGSVDGNKYIVPIQIAQGADINAFLDSGWYFASTDGLAQTMVNRPFDHSFFMLSQTCYNSGTDIRRPRFALSAHGDMKVFNDRYTDGNGGVWYDVVTSKNYASVLDTAYVKKSGDTIMGQTYINTVGKTDTPLYLNGNGSSCYLGMQANGTLHGYYGAVASGPVWNKNGTNNTIWHAGNDGAGSGLDADLLDGKHNGSVSAADAQYLRVIHDIGWSSYSTVKAGKDALVSLMANQGYGIGYPITIGASYINEWSNESAATYASSVYEVIKLSGGYAGSVYGQWLLSGFGDTRLYVIGRNNNAWTTIKTIAYVSDNVASATRLQGSYSLWGQTFYGNNVSGDMTGVGSITASGANEITMGSTAQPHFSISNGTYKIGLLIGSGAVNRGIYDYNISDWMLYRDGTNNVLIPTGNVGIGRTPNSYRLEVNGSIFANGWLRTTGSYGWYSETYGGGWYMSDSTWIRSYGSKNIYHNTGIMRTDGTLQVGQDGATFIAKNSTGYVGVNNINPTKELDVNGTVKVTGNAGNYCEGIRIHPYNNWSTIVLGGTDLGATGTSANSWSLHAMGGNFYVNRNGSSTQTSYLLCNVGGNWGFGNNDPKYKIDALGNMRLASSVSGSGGDVSLELWRGVNASWRILNSGGNLYFQSNFTSAVTSYFNCLTIAYNTGDVGIGTASPAYKLDVNGKAIVRNYLYVASDLFGTGCTYGNYAIYRGRADGEAIRIDAHDKNGNWVAAGIRMNTSGNVWLGGSVKTYKLNVDGVIFASTGIFSNGYVSARGQNTSSDARLKRNFNAFELALHEIAGAPSVTFDWMRDGKKDVGSIAQYWQGINPMLTPEGPDGFLTLQYGKTALLASISIAKRVKSHEERIRRLEKENEELRAELKLLRFNK